MASASSTLHPTNIDKYNPRFNAEAASWDSNPFVNTASKRALTALLSRFPELSKSNPIWDNLEIGCGTGLLSLMIAPYVRRVVAVDAAEGMIDVLKTKLRKEGTPGNVVPVAALLEDPEDPTLPPASKESGISSEGARMKFDLITSHLVLHHIPSLSLVLTTMLSCLKSGGRVALTDFENFGPEAHHFHPAAKMEGVERHGIAPQEMEELMRDVGFEDVRVERAWTMEKRIERVEGEFGRRGRAGGEEEGEVMEFPFVVCGGRRAV